MTIPYKFIGASLHIPQDIAEVNCEGHLYTLMQHRFMNTKSTSFCEKSPA